MASVAGGQVSVLEVLITADATQLRIGMAQAQAATTEYAAATKSASAATTEASSTSKVFGNVTSLAMTTAKLGVLAFAAASVKAAYDFNREFTLIAAVTNTAADKLSGLKDTVLNLSRETAIGPNEIAHSLYFLASAGLTADQQMQALDASAKGAAIGLGDSGDLARITANALNAFSDQGLTASQVMDTLVAAVREGTAEPNEFAQALGRVLPIADQAGISFQSVAASLATMSNAGLDVNEGVTALRATLQSLVAPTAQTQAAFKTMGLTADQVVRSMGSQGLIATLRLVSDAAKKATDTTGEYNILMRHSIPNIRGLAGSLNLLKQDSQKVDDIFQRVKNSTGDMATAFQTTTQSASFQLKAAFNDLMIAGQNLATAVLPGITKALGIIAPIVASLLPYAVQVGAAWLAWTAIPPILSGVAIGFIALRSAIIETSAAIQAMNWQAWLVVGVVAAVATLSTLTGNFKALIPVLGIVGVEIAKVSGIITASQAALGAWALAIFAVEKAWQSYQQLQAQTATASTGFVAQMEGQNDSLAATTERVNAALGPRQKFLDSFFSSHPNFQGYQAFDQAVQQVTTDIQTQNATITKGTPIMDIFGASLNNMSTTSVTLHGALAQLLTDLYNQQGSLKGVNSAVIYNLVSTGKWHAAINLVNEALAKNTAELDKQAHSATPASMLARDFASVIPVLGTLGMGFQDFRSQAIAALQGTTDDWNKFSDAITQKYTDAWNTFKNGAVQALDFTGKALSDLGSQAASAAEQLAGDTSSMSKDALSQLQGQATLTAGEIKTAFQDAAAQTKSFSEDLLQIAKVGGGAGKALAAALLQSGNTAAAAAIAGAGKMEPQLVNLYNKNETMVDKLSTTLTTTLIGPLDKIATILARLARHWGLTVDAKTGKANHDTNNLFHTVDKFTGRSHKFTLNVQDNASHGVQGIQGDVDHLVGNSHKVIIGADLTPLQTALHKADQDINKLTSKQRLIDIGIHLHGNSPMPDEAMKKHFEQPLKSMGFTKVGNVWTTSLDVGAHTNTPSTFQGGSAPKDARQAQRQAAAGLADLKKIEMRQLQVLFDIRHELRGGGGNGGSSGSGTSSGTSSSGSSGSSNSGISSDFNKNLTQQLRDMRIYVSSVQGKKAANKWASAIQQAIQNGNMTREIQLMHQAMRDMADTTGRKEAEKAFHEFQGSVQQFEKMQHQAQFKQFMADALAYATHNVPKLPRGHTNISVNHHEHHKREVTLDRKRFTQSAGYEVDYARGF